jgi:hypothetical protein
VSESFVVDVKEAFGARLFSFYQYGAVTFPLPGEWHLDFDFHAILGEPPTPEEADRFAARIRAEDELDGYFLLLADARRPSNPRCQMTGLVDEAWALHRAHILAGRVRVLAGADPASIVPEPTWDELAAALDGELEFVRTHPQHPAYGTLQLCRLRYSWATHDVVTSKYAAAQWARAEVPGCADLIDAALRVYQQEASPADHDLLAREFAAFLKECTAAQIR